MTETKQQPPTKPTFTLEDLDAILTARIAEEKARAEAAAAKKSRK